jgi:hypothetical protein
MGLFEAACSEVESYGLSQEITTERNFLLRQRALQSASIVKKGPKDAGAYHAAFALESIIAQINASIADKYRRLILAPGATHAAIRDLFDGFTDYQQGAFGGTYYDVDDLDLLIDAVFSLDVDTARIATRREGMVHLERTPSRVVLELIDRLNLTERDTVMDLGSGLGHVLIVLGLLTDARCLGIEIEDSYCRAFLRVLRMIYLPSVAVQNDDVRTADLHCGNVFFMYSPFYGKVMSAVLAKLKRIAVANQIRICSYGNSNVLLAQESWLKAEPGTNAGPHSLAVFFSRIGI